MGMNHPPTPRQQSLRGPVKKSKKTKTKKKRNREGGNKKEEFPLYKLLCPSTVFEKALDQWQRVGDSVDSVMRERQ